VPFTVSARFTDTQTAEAARRTIAGDPRFRDVALRGADLAAREASFIGRIVVIVVLWSVFGTALGAGTGVLIASVFGPEGTAGMVIQAVSWAIFAHLLAGMWAGYWVLADRTRRDLPLPGVARVLLVARCDSIDDAEAAAARLGELGGVDVTTKA
jgi:hypothetical protein